MLALLLAGLLLGATLEAQTDAISVTATRAVDLTAEEVSYGIAILAETDVTLDQVLDAAKTLGVTAKDLGSIGSQQFGPGPNQVRFAYQFTITAPYSKLKETNDKLAALRRTLAANTPSMELQTFGLQIGPTETAREQARQRVLPELVTEARQRAQQLATATGVKLGRVLGVNEFTGPGATGSYGPYGPYGPYGTSNLRTFFSLSVRFAAE